MSQPPDRHIRRRPFSLWMRRLANLKTSSSEARASNGQTTKGANANATPKPKKSITGKTKHAAGAASLDASGIQDGAGQGPLHAPYTCESGSASANELQQEPDKGPSEDQQLAPPSGRSTALTASTEPGTTHSDATRSTNAASGTNTTAGGGPSSKGGGAGSTFSSRAPSERSLTTTLTTIQSTGPAGLLTAGGTAQTPTLGPGSGPGSAAGPVTNGQQNAQFTLQFSSSPTTPSIQSHLAPQSAVMPPTTYHAATANNLLTDNASILTLASSSKRHRRHSLDTDASVRALAPSSLWGGSRESLPLSVLSSNVGELNYPSTPGIPHGRPSLGGITSAERASVYSASGIAPALSSDRGSFYAGKANPTLEGGSVKSGLPGHGRNDSVSGSIGGTSLTVASPRETSFGATTTMGAAGRASRRGSGWAEVSEEMADASDERQGSRKASLHGITQGQES
ncbi:MAG: hypothetical protein M1815_004661 [Lichina confinis]|nr:MAG: hypothetical protein M1815_004661 [Lichina confinis]